MRIAILVLALLVLAMGAGCSEPAAEIDASSADAASADAPIAVDAPGEGDASTTSGWRTEPSVPERIQEISGAVHEGRLWIAGGIDGRGTIVRTVRIFDPASSTWSEGPPLPAPRHHGMLVSTGPALYFVGGMETLSFTPLRTAWVLVGGSWTPIAPLPEDRGAAAAGFAGGRIVVAGGNAARGGLAPRTLLYDPSADAWSLGPSRRSASTRRRSSGTTSSGSSPGD